MSSVAAKPKARKAKCAPRTLRAYAARSGRIRMTFGPIPKGMLPICAGRPGHVRSVVCALARWSYPSSRGANDSVPLVPGIPEADSDDEALEALLAFNKWVKASMDRKAKEAA